MRCRSWSDRVDAYLERGELARAAVTVSACSSVRAVLGDLAVGRAGSGASSPSWRSAQATLRGLSARVNSHCSMSSIAAAQGSSWARPGSDVTLARDDPGARWARAGTHALAAVLFTFAGRDEDALRAVARAMPAVERAGGGGHNLHECDLPLLRGALAPWPRRLRRRSGAQPARQDARRRLPRARRRRAPGDGAALRAHRPPGRSARLVRARRAPSSTSRARARCARWSTSTRPGWRSGAGRTGIATGRGRSSMSRASSSRPSACRAGSSAPRCCGRSRERGSGPWGSSSEVVADSAVSRRREPQPPPRSAARATSGPSPTAMVVVRVKDAKGLHYLAHLLRHPGREFHVLDLVHSVEAGGRRQENRREETGRAVPNRDCRCWTRRRRPPTGPGSTSCATSSRRPRASTTPVATSSAREEIDAHHRAARGGGRPRWTRPPGRLVQRAGPIHRDQSRQGRPEPDQRPPRRPRPPSHQQHQDRNLLQLHPRRVRRSVGLLRMGSRVRGFEGRGRCPLSVVRRVPTENGKRTTFFWDPRTLSSVTSNFTA